MSTLMIFTPAPATELTPGAVPQAVYNQTNSSIVAQETQAAIAQMLEKLPDTSDLRVLREELQSLHRQLATAKNDKEADMLLETGSRAISDRILAEPNASQILDVLMEMREAGYDRQSPNLSSVNILQKTSDKLSQLLANGGSWGFLS